jgi:hypothetical protein
MVSFNARMIIILAVVLLASTFGGLLTVTFFDSRVFPVLGVVTGAVLVMKWSSRGS